jgi:hypothetical protein
VSVIAPALITFGLVASTSTAFSGSGVIGGGPASGHACPEESLSVEYSTVYVDTAAQYEMSQAIVSDIADACLGMQLHVVVSDRGGTVLGSGQVVITSDRETVVFASTLSIDEVHLVRALIST